MTRTRERVSCVKETCSPASHTYRASGRKFSNGHRRGEKFMVWSHPHNWNFISGPGEVFAREFASVFFFLHATCIFYATSGPACFFSCFGNAIPKKSVAYFHPFSSSLSGNSLRLHKSPKWYKTLLRRTFGTESVQRTHGTQTHSSFGLTERVPSPEVTSHVISWPFFHPNRHCWHPKHRHGGVSVESYTVYDLSQCVCGRRQWHARM